MAGEKSVRLAILGDNSDAKRKIEEIDAKAEELKGLDPTLKVGIDTAAANAQMDLIIAELKEAKLSVEELDAAAEELKTAFPKLQVQIDTAVANEKLVATKRAFDDIRDAEIEVGIEGQAALGDLVVPLEAASKGAAKLRDDLAEAAAAIGIVRKANGDLLDSEGKVLLAAEAQALAMKHIRDQALEAAWAVKELDKAEENKSGILGSLGSSILGVGSNAASGVGSALSSGVLKTGLTWALGIEAAVMVIGPEVGALASGFLAAGAGVASFAALAMPAFEKVTSAYSKINTDQKAVDNALTSSARKTALAHLKQDYASLDPNESGALKGVQQLTSSFGQMSKAFEPTAFQVFNEALKSANELLPWLQQFATSAAPAITDIFGGLSKFIESPNFGKFGLWLASLEGPSIKAIASGVEGLVLRFMSLLEMFSKKDVINAINIAFRVLGFTLELVQGLILEGMDAWDLLTALIRNAPHWFDVTRHAISDFGHEFENIFDGMRHEVAAWGHSIAVIFDGARHAVADFAHNVAAHFDEIRHDIAQWVGDVRHDISAAWDWVGNRTDQLITTLLHFFTSLPGKIVNALGNLGSLLLNAGRQIISGLINGIENSVPGLHTALSWVTSLIPSWKGPADKDAQLLRPAGKLILGGLVDGLNDGVPALHTQLTRTTSVIANTRFGGVGGSNGGSALTVEWVGGQGADQEFITWLKKNIRFRGGDPGVLGR